MAGTERDRILNSVARHIARHHLLEDGETVTVALSGGADSVCLLLTLRQLGYDVRAAHCNFHLRGDESQRDQRFVEDLCLRLGVRLDVTHFDTEAEAARTGASIEMAARELRYRWFATLGTKIAIAHHRDDNVETMLLNLVRGTGLRGLCGILPRAEILGASVVRPLLCLSRRDILDFLDSLGQDYVTDSTNLETIARRNIIRLEVMPLLERLNPSVGQTMQENIERLAESQILADEALKSYAARALAPDGSILIEAIDLCPTPLSLLHHLLSPYGFSTKTVEAICADRHGQSGAVYHSATHRLLRHDGRLVISANDAQKPERELKIEFLPPETEIVRDSAVAMLDAAKTKLPLALRHVQKGDRFRPFGMRGSKLVSDFLTDLHLSRFEKEEQLVVTDATGEIVWLAGRRIAQQVAVTRATKEIIRLTLI